MARHYESRMLPLKRRLREQLATTARELADALAKEHAGAAPPPVASSSTPSSSHSDGCVIA